MKHQKHSHPQVYGVLAWAMTILFSLASLPALGQDPGTIITISGANPTGDGGQAIRSILIDPYDVAKDAFGNLYVSGSPFRKILPDGTITNPANLDGFFLDADAQGNLYFLNLTQLKKLDTQGTVTTLAEVNGTGLDVDSNGNSYVTDAIANRLYKITPDGTQAVVAGGGFEYVEGSLATQARLRSPQAVALDGAGNVYFVDAGTSSIRKVDANGIITTVVQNSQVISTFFKYHLGLDPSGTLYLSINNTNIASLYRVEPGNLIPMEAGYHSCGEHPTDSCLVGGFVFESPTQRINVSVSRRPSISKVFTAQAS